MELWQLPVIGLISFLVSVFITRFTIKKFKGKKYEGEDFGHVVPDLHKRGRPLVPRHGGVGVIIGISIGTFISVFLLVNNQGGYGPWPLLGALFTIWFLGAMALYDDLRKLNEIIRIIIPAIASIPLIVTLAVMPGGSSIAIPFFGTVFSFSILYYVLIAVGITGASNATNMLAGFNGLGPGLGLISCSTLFIILVKKTLSVGTTLQDGYLIPASLLIASIGALLGLWIYYFRGKIFPGMANYLIGAIIASVVIMADMILIGIVIMIPHFLELILKARGGFRVKWWGILQKDGTLRPASERIVSVPQLLMKKWRLTERQLVLRLYTIELIFAGTAVVYAFLYL